MLGIVLEGGGAKGAFQIGAWKALKELGIQFDGVAGTSVGALNGAFFMQDDLEMAYDMWYNMAPSKVVAGDDRLIEKIIKMDLESKDFHKVMAGLKKMMGQKGLDISPLRRLIETHLKEEVIRNSPKTFGFVTVSLTDFKPTQIYKEDIPKGQLGEYLIASANLPVFQIDRIDGKLYIDGGFYDNLPINLLTAKGFDEIITIELNGLGFKQKVQDKKNELKITTIKPSGYLGSTLEFLPETARRNLLMGYFDTMKLYKQWIGQNYYLEPTLEDTYYCKWLSGLLDEDIAQMARLMGLPDKDPKRLLFEVILPKFFGLLKLPPKAGYRDLVLALLEHIAADLDIDRYAVFKDNEFVQKVCYELEAKPVTRQIHEAKQDYIPKLVKQTSVYQSFVVNELAYALLDGLLREGR